MATLRRDAADIARPFPVGAGRNAGRGMRSGCTTVSGAASSPNRSSSAALVVRSRCAAGSLGEEKKISLLNDELADKDGFDRIWTNSDPCR
jgi:hypothetical protein